MTVGKAIYNILSNATAVTDEAAVEVYCFNTKYSTAIDLGVAVRAALERKNGTFGGVQIQSINYTNEQMDVNPERSIWVAIQDYTIRIKN